MKKFLPYIILLFVLAGAAIMITTTGKKNKKKELNRRVSFDVKDKIPYGTWVAYNNLKHLFPSASLSTEFAEPGSWDSLSTYGSNQALIIMSSYFYPNETEMESLLNFVKNGNDIFISSLVLGSVAQSVFGVNSSYEGYYNVVIPDEHPDTMRIALLSDSSSEKSYYEFPGDKIEGRFYTTDNSRTYILGYDKLNNANFIRLRAGKGSFYVHVTPMAFTNYFLLHKNNMEYYEKAFSHISKDVKTIVWDEYFPRKRYEDYNFPPREKGFFSELMSYKSFSWAFVLLLLLALLYVLNEMRRRQRFIPEMKKPVNDSMEFVKTIGRLYYEKNDHRNLCRKMGTYFLEYIRSRYNLPTSKLDETFVRTLQFKSGYPENELRSIVDFINKMESVVITDSHLKSFYQRLEKFYESR